MLRIFIARTEMRLIPVQERRRSKMKCPFCVAIVVIALLPTYAQHYPATINAVQLKHISDSTTTSGASDAQSNELIATSLLRMYAGDVDGLLRDLVDQMRAISEQVEAGEISALEAQALKLETARVTIARLETISAIYDLLILTRDDGQESSSAPSGDCTKPALAHIVCRAKPTVSVRELLEESTQ